MGAERGLQTGHQRAVVHFVGLREQDVQAAGPLDDLPARSADPVHDVVEHDGLNHSFPTILRLGSATPPAPAPESPLSAVLARHGMAVRRVACGREAFRALHGVDLVLLDLGLPDVDGVEVIPLAKPPLKNAVDICECRPCRSGCLRRRLALDAP